MTVDWRIPILDEIEHRIDDGLYVGDPLNADKWLASSALQKCIRRGLVELAQRAAARYHQLDRAGLRRRLIAIAFEDIGAADPEGLIETVAATTCSEWRARHGDRHVLLYLVQRLAEAPKDRSADLLIIAAQHHPNLACRRDTCRTAPLQDRLHLITDTSLGIAERAVAAWLSSGLECRHCGMVENGDLPSLAGLYRSAGVTEAIVGAAMIAARATRLPMMIMVPLVWLDIRRTGGATICEASIPDTPVVDGLPLCALDEHTRPGKQAINRLAVKDMRLRACLQQFVPKPCWSTAAQHAAFYEDGSPIAQRLDWSQSHSVEALGIEADLASAQVPLAGVQPLREVMHDCLPRLNEIRREIWDGMRQLGAMSPAYAD